MYGNEPASELTVRLKIAAMIAASMSKLLLDLNARAESMEIVHNAVAAQALHLADALIRRDRESSRTVVVRRTAEPPVSLDDAAVDDDTELARLAAS